MATTTAIVIIVLAMLLAAVIYATSRRRSQRLRTHYGPEYQRALEGYGDRKTAERALEERERRVRKLEIRPLPAIRRDELVGEWAAVQARFVDDPEGATRDAHILLASAMHEQGYPTGRIDEELELLSVHHPAAVQHYRAALALAAARERGRVATEELRQAMVHYRALFEDLLRLGAPRPEERA
jgi:hypothetical protein